MKEGCALGALREVYCSWSILENVAITSVLSAQFIPVPAP